MTQTQYVLVLNKQGFSVFGQLSNRLWHFSLYSNEVLTFQGRTSGNLQFYGRETNVLFMLSLTSVRYVIESVRLVELILAPRK